MLTGWIKKGGILLMAVVLAATLAACGGGNTSNNGAADEGAASNNGGNGQGASDLAGSINIDGSSTVYPISLAMAEEFMKVHPGVNVTVNVSGSSNGFAKLIDGSIDIADASRHIKQEEMDALKEKGWETMEIPVAYDGITVVINPANDWAEDMTVEELKKIWEPGSTVTKWSDIREGWPDEEIHLYGPGTASGTFEYFTEAIMGEAGASRDDYTPSEDDNTLVTGVSGDKYALGYFGYSYYEVNKSTLKAVKINGVEPTFETIADGSYSPLSREIFIYPRLDLVNEPHIKAFIEFYLDPKNSYLVEESGYVPLAPEDLQASLDALYN